MKNIEKKGVVNIFARVALGAVFCCVFLFENVSALSFVSADSADSFGIGGGLDFGICFGNCAECGDGDVDVGDETCDDGAFVPGDGCDAYCQEEPGWTCSGNPSVCLQNYDVDCVLDDSSGDVPGLTGDTWANSDIYYDVLCVVDNVITGLPELTSDGCSVVSRVPYPLSNHGDRGYATVALSFEMGGATGDCFMDTDGNGVRIDTVAPVFTGDILDSVFVQHEGLESSFRSLRNISEFEFLNQGKPIVFRASDGNVVVKVDVEDGAAGPGSGVSGLERAELFVRNMSDFSEKVLIKDLENGDDSKWVLDTPWTFDFRVPRLYELEISVWDIAGNVLRSGRFFMRVVPGNVSQDQSKLTIVDDSSGGTGCDLLLADGVDTCNYRLTLKDEFGNPIRGRVPVGGSGCQFFADSFGAEGGAGTGGVCLDSP